MDCVEQVPIGPDAHILHGKLDASRSQETATEPTYRRAVRLCPGDFQVLDTADGSRSTYVRTVSGVAEVGRGDVALVIRPHRRLTSRARAPRGTRAACAR